MAHNFLAGRDLCRLHSEKVGVIKAVMVVTAAKKNMAVREAVDATKAWRKSVKTARGGNTLGLNTPGMRIATRKAMRKTSGKADGSAIRKVIRKPHAGDGIIPNVAQAVGSAIRKDMLKPLIEAGKTRSMEKADGLAILKAIQKHHAKGGAKILTKGIRAVMDTAGNIGNEAVPRKTKDYHGRMVPEEAIAASARKMRLITGVCIMKAARKNVKAVVAALTEGGAKTTRLSVFAT